MPTQILMPALSPTMTEGNIAKWLKKEGDSVRPGDVVAEIETDKATMEVEAVDEGRIGKILVPEGSQGVAVNTPIAIILGEGEKESDMVAPVAHSAPNAAAVAAPAVAEKSAPKAAQPQASGERVFASPLARRIAEQEGVNLSNIQGSGPSGRIVKADVEKAAAGGSRSASAPRVASGEAFKKIPHSNMRKVIARRLTESKQTVPHFYLSVDCRLDALLDLRKKLNSLPDPEKISVNDFVIRAVALALKKVPAANASWTDEAVLQYEHCDISVAVATPTGLITPIVKSAEDK